MKTKTMMKHLFLLSLLAIATVSAGMRSFGISDHQFELNLALNTALEERDSAKIITALAQGAQIDALDLTSRTPLHRAVSKNDVEIVKLLLEHKARVNTFDRIAETPLNTAASNGNLTMVQLLVIYGANVNQKNLHGITALSAAVEGNDVLSNHFIVSNITTICPSEEDRLKIVKFLVASGAKINQNSGEPPLHRAASAGYFSIVKYLVEHDADPNAAVGESGRTPLHYAHNQVIIDYLLSHGTQNKPDAYGYLPF